MQPQGPPSQAKSIACSLTGAASVRSPTAAKVMGRGIVLSTKWIFSFPKYLLSHKHQLQLTAEMRFHTKNAWRALCPSVLQPCLAMA